MLYTGRSWGGMAVVPPFLFYLCLYALLGILRPFQQSWQMLLLHHLSMMGNSRAWGAQSAGREVMGMSNKLSSFVTAVMEAVLSAWANTVMSHSIWFQQPLVTSHLCGTGAGGFGCTLEAQWGHVGHQLSQGTCGLLGFHQVSFVGFGES